MLWWIFVSVNQISPVFFEFPFICFWIPFNIKTKKLVRMMLKTLVLTLVSLNQVKPWWPVITPGVELSSGAAGRGERVSVS